MAGDYGFDLSATTGVKASSLVRGVRLVAEAVFRRLTTPPGTLRGGPAELDYGVDLAGFVGRVDARSAAAALPGIIRSELSKDDRIGSADATVAIEQSGPGAYRLVIRVSCTTSADEDFALTLAVTDVSTELLGIDYA